ncbi:VMAP-C domain-containing protein [Streptomyces paludis]|uniref:Serine protease n=1 Tax=Streptomyces paludis TaxID=2282738 RepID=A0A345HU45_9ACTN|nr:trypsin-like peptidase domain-containing protein [Streptomyces paludis]AXG80219.1 serine protease [Streptomyces paludis]
MTDGPGGGVGGVGGAPSDSVRALVDLVMAATVRIHGAERGYAPDEPGGSFLGSGFFIAPSWVLTCAHVAMRGEGREVTVVFETGPTSGLTSVTGTVVAALPEAAAVAAGTGIRGGWPAPDLALVRLRRPVEHACVYVAERPASFFAGGTVLYSGWTEVGGRIKRLTGRCSVQGTVGGWADPDEQLRLGGDVLPPGISGGPTVDLARGEVVGVLKSQLVGAMGGTSISIDRLRSLPVPAAMAGAESDDDYQAVCHAHDRYHADQHASRVTAGPTWADVQDGLGAGAGRALSPQQRITLLGRLAELPPPVSTHSLLDLLARLPGMRGGDRYPAPRGWRDGLGALYGTQTRGDEAALRLVLSYCMSVIAAERPYVTPSTARAEENLWEWVNGIADDRLPRDFRQEIFRLWAAARRRTDREQRRASPAYGERPREGERPFVLLELEPRGWERDSYDWRVGVARYTGEVVPVGEDSRGTPGHALPVRLGPSLTEAFRRCDEPDNPAVLQVAVVRARLGLAVDGWRLSPDEPPLGAVRPVLVRPSDQEPPPTEGEAREHRARWDRALTVAVRAEILDCEEGLRIPVPAGEYLRSLAYETVPVLCRYADGSGEPEAAGDPGAVAETAAGLARLACGGFHIALLRRGKDRPEIVCADFHRRAVATVAEAGTADRLPYTVLALRRGVWAGRTETYWSDGIALFYDDPTRPLPGFGQLLEAP